MKYRDKLPKIIEREYGAALDLTLWPGSLRDPPGTFPSNRIMHYKQVTGAASQPPTEAANNPVTARSTTRLYLENIFKKNRAHRQSTLVNAILRGRQVTRRNYLKCPGMRTCLQEGNKPILSASNSFQGRSREKSLRKNVIADLLVITAASMIPGWASATNGINLLGPGAESASMAGADLAVAKDTAAINSNPAGLSQLEGSRFDQYVLSAHSTNVKHNDLFGNDAHNQLDPQWAAASSYGQPIENTPLTFGIGLFAQGGLGFAYDDLLNAFGTRDDLKAVLGGSKLAPAIAWQVTPKLSVGMAIGLVYSTLEQEIFPDTSFVDAMNPSRNFFGYHLKDIDGIHFGAKMGLQYQFNDRVTLGMAYTTATSMDMHGGRLEVDFSGLGLGKVSYRDAELNGLNFPEEFGVGLAIQATDQLLVSVEANWINWSDAMSSATLKARKPDNPMAPPSLTIPTTFDWRDQYVIALGVEYDVNERLSLRAGYNYGRNPVPDEHLTPLLALIGEHHFAVGAAYSLTGGWELQGAVHIEPKTSVTYTNPNVPLGPGAKETREGYFLHFSVAREW